MTTSPRHSVGGRLRIILITSLLLAPGTLCLGQAQESASGSSVGLKPPQRVPGGLSPRPVITSVSGSEVLEFEWFGFQGPYTVEATDATGSSWEALITTQEKRVSIQTDGEVGLFRVDGARPNYAGAASCGECHASAHAHWHGTAHAEALETLKQIGQDQNSHCLACHTVAYGSEGGFVSEEETPWLGGVQCENCHGPAANHAANPSDASVRPLTTVSSVVCGGCHTEAHHPTYDEWDFSRHSQALAGLRGSSHAQDHCMSCHSEDYRYAVANELPVVPTLETATMSLECSTCHEPHGDTEEAYLLRKAVGPLCGECHTQGEAPLGRTPHHPQYEMLQGIGAYEEDGSPLVQLHGHSTLAAEGGQACAQCHVVRYQVDSPNEGNPNVTGHTFNPFDETIPAHQGEPYTGCMECHRSSDTLDSARRGVQQFIKGRLASLAPYFTPGDPLEIDRDALSAEDQERYDVAKFNYQFVGADGSYGNHNLTNARVALDISQAIVESLTSAP